MKLRHFLETIHERGFDLDSEVVIPGKEEGEFISVDLLTQDSKTFKDFGGITEARYEIRKAKCLILE